VATISRMLKNIGLFCKRALQKRPIFCKETYIFKHPTNRSHPITIFMERTLYSVKKIDGIQNIGLVYVSLQNIGLFCRAFLQKRPIFLCLNTEYRARLTNTHLNQMYVGIKCVKLYQIGIKLDQNVSYVSNVHLYQIYGCI